MKDERCYPPKTDREWTENGPNTDRETMHNAQLKIKN